MEYTNPVTGGPAMPTIGCYVQLLRPGEHTQAHRRTSSAAFHVVEGSGYSVVAGQRLDWEDKDVFCVPSWTFHEHVNTGDQPAILFSHTDVPVMRSLDLYREEVHPAGRQ
jgi:gentisate 1,2-dioxygenase